MKTKILFSLLLVTFFTHAEPQKTESKKIVFPSLKKQKKTESAKETDSAVQESSPKEQEKILVQEKKSRFIIKNDPVREEKIEKENRATMVLILEKEAVPLSK